MGRPPGNGGPAFRFTPPEVAEMEAILQEHNYTMPTRDVLTALAEKFSESPERKGKSTVQMKQVWNWFQNKRYAIRAKSSKASGPGNVNVAHMPSDDSAHVRNIPQPMAAQVPVASVPTAGKAAPENSVSEFEAKSGRDGAWYDVATFLSHRYLETSDPEVLVRFAGFGPEEDEWVHVPKYVRLRSLPCESSECFAILPGDLILCFQEGKEQALYFDAHVLDAQRRRHDVRGCRCRFLVRYDHDQAEEIVPLRKICRRPETDYRLQHHHAGSEAASGDKQKTGMDLVTVNATGLASSAEMVPKVQNANTAVVVPVQQENVLQPKNLDAKNAETGSDIEAVNLITSLGRAALANNAAMASVPVVPGQNMPEGK